MVIWAPASDQGIVFKIFLFIYKKKRSPKPSPPIIIEPTNREFNTRKGIYNQQALIPIIYMISIIPINELKILWTSIKKYLESQLEIEKTKVENDSKKFQALLNEYNREKEQLVQQQQLNKLQLQQQQLQQQSSKDSIMSASQDSSPNLSRFTSFFEAKNELRSSFDLSAHNPSALNTLEMLQSKLKQREGEISQLQV